MLKLLLVFGIVLLAQAATIDNYSPNQLPSNAKQWEEFLLKGKQGKSTRMLGDRRLLKTAAQQKKWCDDQEPKTKTEESECPDGQVKPIYCAPGKTGPCSAVPTEGCFKILQTDGCYVYSVLQDCTCHESCNLCTDGQNDNPSADNNCASCSNEDYEVDKGKCVKKPELTAKEKLKQCDQAADYFQHGVSSNAKISNQCPDASAGVKEQGQMYIDYASSTWDDAKYDCQGLKYVSSKESWQNECDDYVKKIAETPDATTGVPKDWQTSMTKIAKDTKAKSGVELKASCVEQANDYCGWQSGVYKVKQKCPTTYDAASDIISALETEWETNTYDASGCTDALFGWGTVTGNCNFSAGYSTVFTWVSAIIVMILAF